jgi:hypothetical protein
MSSDALNRLIAMANIQVDIEADVERIDAELKKRKEALRQISEVDLPDLMSELGIDEFKLSSGKVVKIKPDIRFEEIEARKLKLPKAILWLTKNGYDGIVKSTVIASFGKGEKKKAEATLKELKAAGVVASLDEGINAQTLKSFLKERLNKEEQVPLDLFGAYPFNKAVIS